MAKDKKIKGCVCPGCSRHCPMGQLRCKYGQKYFEKRQKQQAVQADCTQKADEDRRRCKWEKHVKEGGLAWKLLWAGRVGKKTLRRKKKTEAQVLSALTEPEKEQLGVLLDKIIETLG